MHPNTEELFRRMTELKSVSDDLIHIINQFSDDANSVNDAIYECVYFIYDLVVAHLPHSPDKAIHGFWANNAEEIMCKTREEAETIADFFEALGVDCMHTYRYDDPTQPLFDLWAVYVDGM